MSQRNARRPPTATSTAIGAFGTSAALAADVSRPTHRRSQGTAGVGQRSICSQFAKCECAMGDTDRQLALGALTMARGHYQAGRSRHAVAWCTEAKAHARRAGDDDLAEWAEKCAEVAEGIE